MGNLVRTRDMGKNGGILAKYLMMGNLILIFEMGQKMVDYFDKHCLMMGNLILIFEMGEKMVGFFL